MFGGTKELNDRATLREYREAVEEGNISLAKRIMDANPDLFPKEEPEGDA